MIGVDGQPARRRPTLSIWAALASMAALIAGLVMLGLPSWYDLEDFHAITEPSRDSYTTDGNSVGGLGWWLITAAALFVVGILVLVLAILTIAMLNGSRVASRLAAGLAAAFALSCGALSLFGPYHTLSPVPKDPNTLVVTVNRNPATTPRWANWSEVAGLPVFMGGAALTTVVLLLPSTRRDLHARRRPT